MAVKRTILASDIREELGCPSTMDLTTGALDGAINHAMRTYSKYVPFLKDISVTVPTNGLVKADDDVVIIIATSWSTRSSDVTFDVGTVFGFGPGTFSQQASQSFFELAKLNMDIFLGEYVTEQIGTSIPHEVQLSGDYYEFLPTPTSPEPAMLRVGILQTDATFPNRHYEVLKKGAAALAAKRLALRRHKFSSVNIGGESLNLSGPQTLMDVYNKEWGEFIRDLGPLRKTLMSAS